MPLHDVRPQKLPLKQRFLKVVHFLFLSFILIIYFLFLCFYLFSFIFISYISCFLNLRPRSATTHTYNATLPTVHFPSQWKVAQIIMIVKPGKNPNYITSYRPISLLPTLSKILDKTILKRLTPIKDENNLNPTDLTTRFPQWRTEGEGGFNSPPEIPKISVESAIA